MHVKLFFKNASTRHELRRLITIYNTILQWIHRAQWLNVEYMERK